MERTLLSLVILILSLTAGGIFVYNLLFRNNLEWKNMGLLTVLFLAIGIADLFIHDGFHIYMGIEYIVLFILYLLRFREIKRRNRQ